MRFIHCSDLHIDSPLLGLERYPGAPAETMRASTRTAFDNVVSAAIDNQVDLMVIAGDVFDGNWPDYKTGLHFTSRLSRLRDAGIPVVMVRGNHDAESHITRSLRMPDNVIVLDHRKAHTKHFEHLGVAVHGQSFADRAVPEDLAASYPRAASGFFNIGVLHTSLGGYATHATYAPTTLDVLRGRDYQYWALGHVHERQILCDQPRVVFSGNTQGRHAREGGPKGCELVSVEDDVITSEPLRIDAVRWARLDINISGLPDVDALLDRARRELGAAHALAGGRVLAVRIALIGSGPLHTRLSANPESVVAELRSLATDATDGSAWIEKVQHDTRAQIDRATLAQRDDPFGELLRLSSQLEDSPAELQSLVREALGPLLDKLPPDVRADMLRLDDPEHLKHLLREAEGRMLGLLAEKAAP